MFIYLIKLLIMLSCTFIFILIQSLIWGQVNDVDISSEYRNVNYSNTQYLEKLKNDIKFYFLSNNFLETNNQEIEISLDIDLILESISDNNIVSAHVLFSNRQVQNRSKRLCTALWNTNFHSDLYRILILDIAHNLFLKT